MGTAVYEETARLAALIRDGKIDAYINAEALRRDHMARCYPAGQSAGQMREQNLQFITDAYSQSGFAISVLPRAQGQFRIQADGRLFDWVGTNGEPLVTISTDEMEPAPLSFQFSVLAGRLTLVR